MPVAALVTVSHDAAMKVAHRIPLVAFAVLAFASASIAPLLAQESTRRVRIDGKFEDWLDGGGNAVATPQYVFFKVTMPEEFTLQGGERTTRIALDVDAKDTTGKADGEGDAKLGVDLEIWLNPPSQAAKKGAKDGLEIRAYDDAGIFDGVKHAAIDFSFSPSFASREYEFRLGRTVTLKEPVGSRYRASTRMRGRVEIFDTAGQRIAEVSRLEVALPPSGATIPYDAAIPPKPEGAIRLVSWNVEWEGPEKNPPPFARILTKLDADILHLQEWKVTEQDLAAWFSAHVPKPEAWRAHTHKELGTSIVTRFPLTPLTTKPLMQEPVGGKPKGVIRFVAARVETPLGNLVSGSMHLKCCGAKGTVEDLQRIAQTETIEQFLFGEMAKAKGDLPLLSGDMNLVGTRTPLDKLAARLDSDGSDLSIADAYVLGGDSTYTWSEADSAFSPGRLDYALYPDSELEVANTFVLDVERFRGEAVGKAGLQSDDFKASDHRPLVVDLVRRKSTVAAPPVEDLTAKDLLAMVADGSAEVTLVNFWATWCRPCVAELPDLIQAAKSAPAGNVRLVLVSFDDLKDRAKASQLLSKLGVDFPTFLKKGTDQEFLDEIDPSWEGTLPLTLAYNRAGKLVARHQNQATADDFIQLIESARRGGDSK